MEILNTYQPWSQEAEQTVIGSLIADPRLLADIQDIICPADFYSAEHEKYFKAIVDVSEKISVDLITVFNRLETYQGGTPQDFTYLTEITLEGVSYSNVTSYAKIIKAKSNERQVLSAFIAGRQALIDEDTTNSEDRVNNALAHVAALDFTESKTDDFRSSMRLVVEGIEDRLNQTGAITGIGTGFADIDEATCGFQKTDLIIIGARPSMGKTTLAMNIAATASLNGQEGVTLIFSMEMSQQQLQQRLLASEGGLRLHAIQRPKEMRDYEWELLSGATRKMADANMVIDDRSSLSPQQVRGKCIREQRKHGKIKMVVVDYLQLMCCPGEKGGRTMEITRISGALKAIAKEFDCPVIALSQLNRTLESRSDKRPIMADLRESGSIEQDADIIMFLYRDEVYNPDSEHKGFCELIISKFRAGQIQTIPLRSDLARGRFRDMNGESLPEITQHENNKSKGTFGG